MEQYDIYLNKELNRVFLGYDGCRDACGAAFLCSATQEEIENEIFKRDQSQGMERFDFQDLSFHLLEKISNVFSESIKLLEAVASFDEDLVKDLICEGADPNFRGVGGKTPLMIAAEFGYEEHFSLVKLLTRAGARVELQDEMGFTALDYANKVLSGDTWEPYASDFLREKMEDQKRDLHLQIMSAEQRKTQSSFETDIREFSVPSL